MPPSDPHHEQEGTASGESTAPATAPGQPRGPLDAMRRQLEQHSALEDLGPLFGPQAQGEGSGREGPGRDGHARGDPR